MSWIKAVWIKISNEQYDQGKPYLHLLLQILNRKNTSSFKKDYKDIFLGSQFCLVCVFMYQAKQESNFTDLRLTLKHEYSMLLQV